MEKASSNVNKGQERINKPANSPPVEINRTFHAPVERVWKAWSTPELIKQWWGPEGFTSPAAQLDFREGGKYLFAMKDPGGKVMWSGGIFEEIVAKKKIAWSDHFADQDGYPLSANDVGMAGDWPQERHVTIKFESAGTDETEVSVRHEGIPKEMHDDCVSGWSSSIDKLQKLVERN